MRPRSPDSERGVVLPWWSIGVSIGVVVVAMLALVMTGSPDRHDDAAASPASASSTPSDQSATPTASASPTHRPSSRPPRATPKQQPRERPDQSAAPHRDAYVEVYNNSTVRGLANQTAAELQDAGWKVVGADNWYGSIPESTVYYPERLHPVAKLLAADLGITRLHTAVAPMRFDRLTVILTGPL